jgi:Ca2+-binding EF-hand superfamily protein
MTTPSLNIAKVKNNSYQYLHFSTKSYKEWNELYNLWCKDGEKVIPKDEVIE